jgi:Right handed beta helix region
MAAAAPAPKRSVFRSGKVLAALLAAVLAISATAVLLAGAGEHPEQDSAPASASAAGSATPSQTLTAPPVSASASPSTSTSASPSASVSASGTPPAPGRRTPTATAPTASATSSVSTGTTPPPKPATKGCLPHPSACGYPDATNTGVPPGTALVHSTGILTITKAGTVVSGRDVTGHIEVDANNVTIKDSRITTNQFYGVYTAPGFDGTVITDVTIIGSTASGGRCDEGIQGGVFHATRVNVSKCSDGFHLVGSGSVVDSYFHNPYFTGSSHNDGIQVFNGTGLVIRHNTIDMGGPNGNSCVFLQPTSGRIKGATIDSNLLNGGGFTLYIEQSTGVVLSNNRVGRAYNFAWFSRAHNTHDPVVNHNVWDDTGTPVS